MHFAKFPLLSLFVVFLAPLALVLSAYAQSAEPATPVAARSGVFRQAEVTEKPRAPYTSLARQNMVEGSIRLRVTLLANGQVGNVSPLNYLPYGLTQQAVASAKGIRFRPQLVNGEPVDAVIQVDYNFSLYYEDADADIKTKVAIIERPKPMIARSELPSSANGEIVVEVFFGDKGRITVFKYVTPLSDDLKKRVDYAVAKIKFRPAIHVNGKKMSVTKVVRYQL